MLGIFTILFLCQLDHFNFAPINSPQVAGDSFQITIYAYDVDNHIITNYNAQAWIISSLGPTYSYKVVSFTSGVCLTNIMVTLATNIALTCNDFAGVVDTSNYFDVIANGPNRLLSIVPNQTYAPGTDSGKTGPVIGQSAGGQFNIDIYLTDIWFNHVDTVNHMVNYITTDQFVGPAQTTLSNGIATVPFTFRTAGYQKIYFQDITNSVIKTDTSSQIQVFPGEYSKLLVILPGETHLPGDSTSNDFNTPGKLGTPNNQYATEDFEITVYATDSMWNKTSVSGNMVALYSDFVFSNPSPEALANGAVQFTVNFPQAGNNQNIWAQGNGFTSYRNYLNILAVIDTTAFPDSFSVYPNPMGIESQQMNFSYYLNTPCDLIFAIYDPFGNLVYRVNIAPGQEGARSGLNHIIWNGRNGKGKKVASGIYYVILKGWTHTETIFDKKIAVGVVW